MNKYFEWPTKEEFQIFPGFPQIKHMTFKAGNYKTFSGIQITLTNEKDTVTSPVLGGTKDNDPLKQM